MDRRIVRQKRVNRAPIFILLALIFLLIGIIVTVFSFFVVEDLNADPMAKVVLSSLPSSEESKPQSMIGEAPGGILAAAVASREAMQQSTPTSDTSSQEYVQENYEVVYTKVDTLVPESPAVDPRYFEDALFIGDSVTQGFRNSGFIPAKNIIAEKNINLNELVANKASYQGKTKTLYEMIDSQMPNPKKIYILLGLNNLPGTDNDVSMQYYRRLLETIQATYPDSMIFVESLTPMMQNSEYTKRFSSAKIDDFNVKLLALAEEMGIYYLDLQTVLKDANGYLIGDYSSPDGLHLVKNGHAVMYEYFLTHTVQPDGYTNMIVR